MTEKENHEALPDDEGRGMPTEQASEGPSAEGAAPTGDGVAPDFEAFENDFGEGSELLKTQEKLEVAQEELARARAETYNVRQEYGNYVRRSKEEATRRQTEAREDVVEVLLPVLDDIEAARAAGDLAEGPFASIADKLEDILGAQFGLVRFGAPGEVFDPTLHDALMAQANPEVTETVIAQVLQPGFKVGDRVLRPTKVIVDNPA